MCRRIYLLSMLANAYNNIIYWIVGTLEDGREAVDGFKAT